MRKLKLATGVEYEVVRCGAADGVLWIGFQAGALTLVEAITVFSDPNATGKMVMSYDFDGMDETFEGYTDCIYGNKDTEDGRVLIALRRVAE